MQIAFVTLLGPKIHVRVEQIYRWNLPGSCVVAWFQVIHQNKETVDGGLLWKYSLNIQQTLQHSYYVLGPGGLTCPQMTQELVWRQTLITFSDNYKTVLPAACNQPNHVSYDQV